MNKLTSYFRKIFPKTHGTVYDVIVFLGAFFVPFLFSSVGNWLRELSESSQVLHGWMLLLAVLLQIPAALLKCHPLQMRLRNSDSLKDSSNLLPWLLFLYWLFGFFAITFAITALTDWSAMPSLLIIFTLASLCTATLYFTIAGDLDVLDIFGTLDNKWELLADGILILAAIVFSYTMWQPMVDEVASGQGHIRREASGSFAGAIAYGLVMAIPFGTFYIAPRLLFLVEDLKVAGTWVRLLLIYLFAAWSMFYG